MGKTSNFFIVFLLLGLTACRKERAADELVEGAWKLTGAELCIENLDTRIATRYTYFNDTLLYNCIDIDGCREALDSVCKNRTTWEISSRNLLLNGNKNYEHQYKYPSMRFYPTDDGSARVFSVEFINMEHMIVIGRETYESLGDTNYHYYSILYFDRLP